MNHSTPYDLSIPSNIKRKRITECTVSVTVKMFTLTQYQSTHNTKCEKVRFNIKPFINAASGLSNFHCIYSIRQSKMCRKVLKMANGRKTWFTYHFHSLSLFSLIRLFAGFFFDPFVIEITHVQNANIAIIHNFAQIEWRLNFSTIKYIVSFFWDYVFFLGSQWYDMIFSWVE